MTRVPYSLAMPLFLDATLCPHPIPYMTNVLPKQDRQPFVHGSAVRSRTREPRVWGVGVCSAADDGKGPQ
eukprot:41099-Eustigmatos_ZCMA.PRE.1